MKKTVTVNLNGRVFTMDEDAYQLLDKYLNNLRIYFRKEDGATEIIADFESRIEELFSDKIRLGYEVITIADVEEIIARVGKPDDFSDEPISEEEKEEPRARVVNYEYVKKKLFRNPDDQMLGGLCSGVAAYFGWDALAVRIIMVVLAFATSFVLLPIYLVFWLIVPVARTAEQKLQMRGQPITVENIGKTVSEGVDPNMSVSQNRGCLSGLLEFLVGLLKVFLIGLGIIVGLPLIFALFIIVVVLFAVIFGVGGGLLAMPFALFGADSSVITIDHPMVATISFVVLLAIPLIALIYTIIAHLAKLRPVHPAVKWVTILIWIIALVVLCFSGFRFNKEYISNNSGIPWSWNYDDNENTVAGNGIPTEAGYALGDSLNSLSVEKNLWANIQIEQLPGDSSYIIINGDENLVDKVKYQIKDKELILTTHNNARLRSNNNLIIRLQTPELKALNLQTIGSLNIPNQYMVDELKVRVEGVTRLQIDSLQARNLEVYTEGIGSSVFSGTASSVILFMHGAGNIDAFLLKSDSVKAKVEGVGSIKCDPVQYLDARVEGIGTIAYRAEPENKIISVEGLGKVVGD